MVGAKPGERALDRAADRPSGEPSSTRLPSITSSTHLLARVNSALRCMIAPATRSSLRPPPYSTGSVDQGDAQVERVVEQAGAILWRGRDVIGMAQAHRAEADCRRRRRGRSGGRAGSSRAAVPVIFGDRGLHCLGRGDIVQFRDLHAVLERAILGKRCISLVRYQLNRSRLPDAGEGLCLIAVEAGFIGALVMGDQRVGEIGDVRRGEVQALAPVGGTMCAEIPARNRRPWRIGSNT